MSSTSKRTADGYGGWVRGSGQGAGAASAMSASSSGRFLLARSKGRSEDACWLHHCGSSTTSTADGSAMFTSTVTAETAALETATRDRDATSVAAADSAEGGIQPGEEGPPAFSGPEHRGLGAKRASFRRIWKDGPGEDANSEQARTAREQYVATSVSSGRYSTHTTLCTPFWGG